MRDEERWAITEGDEQRPYVVHDRLGVFGDFPQRSRAVAVRMVRQRNRKLPWPPADDAGGPPATHGEDGP